jgi:hypothetical protein
MDNRERERPCVVRIGHVPPSRKSKTQTQKQTQTHTHKRARSLASRLVDPACPNTAAAEPETQKESQWVRAETIIAEKFEEKMEEKKENDTAFHMSWAVRARIQREKDALLVAKPEHFRETSMNREYDAKENRVRARVESGKWDDARAQSELVRLGAERQKKIATLKHALEQEKDTLAKDAAKRALPASMKKKWGGFYAPAVLAAHHDRTKTEIAAAAAAPDGVSRATIERHQREMIEEALIRNKNRAIYNFWRANDRNPVQWKDDKSEGDKSERTAGTKRGRE